MKHLSPKSLAVSVARKHPAVHGRFDMYPGIVTLHGLARLAALQDDAALLEETRGYYLPFVRGEVTFYSNFPNYFCGGLGTAYLLWKGLLPEAKDEVRKYAVQLMTEAPRNPEGIFSHPKFPTEDRVWIDVAFAVSPFLVYAGLVFDEEAYIGEGIDQTEKMYHLLLDSENGLVHQSKGFGGRLANGISEDHWSRGNGWLAYSLAELIAALPPSHPRRPDVEKIYTDLMTACVAFQNGEGLWHQEMTNPDSYVETSGSGLILYAMGAGVECGLLDAGWQAKFETGLKGLSRYISQDFDVFHTCRGCLCPANGSQLNYMAKPPVLNDPHAFGPVALAFGQAHRLGIQQLQ